MGDSGISRTTYKSFALRCREITPTGRMLFRMPNHQCQSTEILLVLGSECLFSPIWLLTNFVKIMKSPPPLLHPLSFWRKRSLPNFFLVALLLKPTSSVHLSWPISIRCHPTIWQVAQLTELSLRQLPRVGGSLVQILYLLMIKLQGWVLKLTPLAYSNLTSLLFYKWCLCHACRIPTSVRVWRPYPFAQFFSPALQLLICNLPNLRNTKNCGLCFETTCWSLTTDRTNRVADDPQNRKLYFTTTAPHSQRVQDE